MEQFVALPSSVIIESVKTLAETKLEFPKYPAEKKPCTKLVRLKRKQKKICWSNQTLCRNYLVLSTYQSFNFLQRLSLYKAKTGTFVSILAQRLLGKNVDFAEAYLILLDVGRPFPTLNLKQNVTAKGMGTWVRFQFWMTKFKAQLLMGLRANFKN